MPKYASVVIAVFTVLFLIFSPQLFLPHIKDDLYSVKAAKKQPEYRGIMTMWNVGETSHSSAFLNAAIAKIEKNKTRVYIEKENMTEEKCIERLSSGEKPDMLCFSSKSPVEASFFCPLAKREGMIPGLYSAGKLSEASYAVPFLCGISVSEDGKEASLVPCFIAVPATEDALKLRMCEDIISTLLSLDMQRTLAENGRVPVLADRAVFETENDITYVYDELLGDFSVENVFS